MSGFYGADTAQLRDYGDLLNTGGRQLSELASQLASQVSSVEWVGADAEAFRSDFSGRVNGLFDSAHGLMDRYRQDIGVHADEQDEVSEPESGGILEGIGGAIWDFLEPIVGGINDVLGHPLVGQVIDWGGTALSFLEGLGKSPLLRTIGQIGGRILSPLSIWNGVNQMFNPQHDGWRGVGDRIAGGLSVVAGIAAWVPGPGWIIAGIAGGISAAWNLGNLIADNWDGITSTVSDIASGIGNLALDVGGATMDFASDVGNAAVDFAGDVGEAAVDFAGDVAGGIVDFATGLF